MNCYVCVNAKHPGGMYYHVQPAFGICQGCGVGVCQEHGKKMEGDGRLLCDDCAESQKQATPRAA